MNEKWTQAHRAGDDIGDPSDPYRYYGKRSETEWVRSIRHCGEGPRRKTYDGGVTLTLGHNYPGWPNRGGEFASKPEQWPVVKLLVALPEGRYDLQEDLAERLAAAVEEFVARFPELEAL